MCRIDGDGRCVGLPGLVVKSDIRGLEINAYLRGTCCFVPPDNRLHGNESACSVVFVGETGINIDVVVFNAA